MWSSYTPGHWVPFYRLLRLAELRWRYSIAPPHGRRFYRVSYIGYDNFCGYETTFRYQFCTVHCYIYKILNNNKLTLIKLCFTFNKVSSSCAKLAGKLKRVLPVSPLTSLNCVQFHSLNVLVALICFIFGKARVDV
jgi:hypothetical protein